jgi:hypothetical protein
MARPKKKKARKGSRQKRPIAVTIIVLLVIGEILLRLYWVVQYALQTKLWLNGMPWPLWEAGWLTDAAMQLAANAFRLLWLLVAIAVLIGLLRMRRWSWVALAVWVGISLSVGILHYFYRSISDFTQSDYAIMAADMVMVFALNQLEVQRIFGVRRDDAGRSV